MEKRQEILKIKIVIIFLMLVFQVFICLFIYPFISATWNRYVESRLITQYNKQISSDQIDYQAKIEEAKKYNQKLYESDKSISSYTDTSIRNENGILQYKSKTDKEYESLLKISDQGMMGYINIPAINVHLPIYHYAEEESLNKGAGHMIGSSLPVGGNNTHSVITGHCGLPNATMFTDLVHLTENDVFTVTTYNQTIAYKIDQIETVLPEQCIDYLQIIPNEDHMTLITCTPYGVNSHRLLVRGTRISLEEAEKIINNLKEAKDFGFHLTTKDKLCILGILLLECIPIFVIIKTIKL